MYSGAAGGANAQHPALLVQVGGGDAAYGEKPRRAMLPPG